MSTDWVQNVWVIGILSAAGLLFGFDLIHGYIKSR